LEHDFFLASKPYPRQVQSDRAETEIRERLDTAYDKYVQGGGRSITRWLRSDEARAIYQEAWNRFFTMEIAHPENRTVLEQAHIFLTRVPDHYTPLLQ
jgi:hypothetical protein